MKNILVTLACICIVFSLNSQSTGSFQESITFNEPDYSFTRSLYYYVPSDYNPNNQYKLVVGFRGGPHTHAGQFRDQLAFLSDSIGAIIMCPENSSHFNNQEGLTKQLFQYSVDTTMSIYNIDPDFIYLTGLSYGGRHAVRVSMDSDDGPIPNLRGVIPFAAGVESHLQPNYENIADFPPACICIGLSDAFSFRSVANQLHNDIITNGGTSLLNEITGVGHTVAFPTYPSEMMKCMNFIEEQYEITATSEHENSTINLVVSPNPSNSYIEFDYDNSFNPTQVFIVDMTGKMELNIPIDSKTVNITQLSSGNKILILKNKTKSIQKPFVVAH